MPAAVLWAPVIGLARDELHKFALASDVTTKGLAAILAVLDNVVGQKLKRFGDFLIRVRRNPEASLQAFQEITQPVQQFHELVRSLHDLFAALDDERNSFKISLAIISESGKVAGIPSHYPAQQRVRSDPDKLSDPCSTIMRTVEFGQIQIIESIKEEAKKKRRVRRFVVTSPARADEDGSLICYPVIHSSTGKTAMVISVFCSKPKYFKEYREEIYEGILSRFALRCDVEYTLYLIKDIYHEIQYKG